MSLILLIDDAGNKVGNMSLVEAEKLAKLAKKDLILVDIKNNVYKMDDRGKIKYIHKQKMKQQKVQHRTHKVKEIQIKPNTDIHDIDVKINHIKEFLTKGFTTKLIMKFSGRQITHKEVGVEKFNRVIQILGEYIKLDKEPYFEGVNLVALLRPNK